jgi:diguanylate cyclase (GGDEF)-like protein
MQANGIDPSTGFLDRGSCLELVSKLAFSAAASGQLLAAFWIDLSRLKQVNESFGHLGGDLVITQIAQRLREKSAGRGEWCRMGGDEFVCLIPNCDAEHTRQLAQDLLQAIEQITS